MAVYPGEGWRGQDDKVSGNHVVEQGLQSWDAYGVGWLGTETQIKGLKQKHGYLLAPLTGLWPLIQSCNSAIRTPSH